MRQQQYVTPPFLALPHRPSCERAAGADIEADTIQLEASFGSSFARSTESIKMETLRTLRPREATEKTCSTTRVTIQDTSREPF